MNTDRYGVPVSLGLGELSISCSWLTPVNLCIKYCLLRNQKTLIQISFQYRDVIDSDWMAWVKSGWVNHINTKSREFWRFSIGQLWPRNVIHLSTFRCFHSKFWNEASFSVLEVILQGVLSKVDKKFQLFIYFLLYLVLGDFSRRGFRLSAINSLTPNSFTEFEINVANFLMQCHNSSHSILHESNTIIQILNTAN